MNLPPTSASSVQHATDPVETMKHNILCGNLRVQVFNEQLVPEPKRLALNPDAGEISLLRDNGLYEDGWAMNSLQCIVQGIDASILDEPPPPDRAVALKFRSSIDGEEEEQDLFLCVVFESA